MLGALKNLCILMEKCLSESLNHIIQPGAPAYNLALAFDCFDSRQSVNSSNGRPNILEDIIGSGFLWAVPKHRRTIEKRATRRMGFGKMIIPKKSITSCQTCGNFYEHHTVCGYCYEKVKKETELMQEAIKASINLQPIEREVVVLYENDLKNEDVVANKTVVELPRKRPPWFCKNLLIKDSENLRPKESSVGEAQMQPIIKDL